MSGRKHLAMAAAVLLTLIAVGRALLTYSVTPQAFDEPVHVAAAVEWLDKGTYTLDPIHPPLARVAIGLPLYLAGKRFPQLDTSDPMNLNYYVIGNHILYDDSHYLRNLALARSGMIPFLVLATALVFLWGRRELGDLAGVMAAGLFSTLPIVLAFSSLAYTDMTAACMQFAAFYALANWLETPSPRSSLRLGVLSGLALLSKMTTVIFLPAVAAGMLVCRWWFSRATSERVQAKWTANVAIAALIAVFIVWGGYKFSVGHMRESTGISVESMPSFQHFPAPVRVVARKMVLADSLIPAPELVMGAATAWALNQNAEPAYLFGHIRNGGWWYFFLVALAVKTPLPFLILGGVGLAALFAESRRGRWRAFAPAAAAVAILVVTTSVKYNAGLRHILVIFPLLAVVGGSGAAYLWKLQGRLRTAGRVAVAALLLWQGIASYRASGDYIAYFNELAGSDPSRILVAGCDLDCGQDVFRLSQALRERQVTNFGVAVWSSAELSRLGFPPFAALEPYKPVTGWVAISRRAARFGNAFHTTYPPEAYAWLSAYPPVAQVGKSILLYHIPQRDGQGVPGEAR